MYKKMIPKNRIQKAWIFFAISHPKKKSINQASVGGSKSSIVSATMIL